MLYVLYWWNSAESVWERTWNVFDSYRNADHWRLRFEQLHKVRVCVWGIAEPRPTEPPEAL